MQKNPISAGIIPFRFQDGGEPYFLILRAFSTWDFPKGWVEKDEEPLKGAIRELQEETSLTEVSFPFGESYYETEPYTKKKKIARYYLGKILGGEAQLLINKELGHPEHHEFKWVTVAEADKMLDPRVRKALAWAEELVRES